MKSCLSEPSSFNHRLALLTAVLLISVLTSLPLYAGIAFKGVEKDLSDPEKIESFLEDIRQRSLDSGVVNFTPYSLMLIKESLEAVSRKEFETAAILSDYARKLSPDIPPVYAAKAQVRWSKNRTLVYLPFLGYIQSFVKGLSHLEGLSFIIFSNAATAVFSILFTAVLYVFILAVRYFGLFYHDARHHMNKNFPNSVIMIGVLFVFFFPVFLGFTVLWLVPLWLLILLGYLKKQERLGAIAVFLLLLIVPFLLFFAGLGMKLSASKEAGLLWKINFEYWDKNDLEKLKALNEQNPEDEDVLFSLGLAYKKNGDFEDALSVYQALLDQAPESYRCLVNLGNVYLSMGKWQDAVDLYEQAIKRAPGKCDSAHFNLSRAYAQKFMFDESEAEFLKAKEIEVERAEKSYKNSTEHYNRMVIDETVPGPVIIKRVFNLLIKERSYGDEICRLFFGPVSLRCSFFMMVALFMAAMILLKVDRLRIAMRCMTCGKALCHKCQKDIPKEAICTQCLNFYREQDHFDQGMKQTKKVKVRRYQRFYASFRNTLGCFFPGSALIWKGYALPGLFMLFVSVLLFFKILMMLIFRSPWAFLGLTQLPLIVFYTSALAVLWVVSVITTFKLRDINLKKTVF